MAAEAAAELAHRVRVKGLSEGSAWRAVRGECAAWREVRKEGADCKQALAG